MAVLDPPPAQPRPSSQAVTALVLSILGFVTCCGLVVSPFGWHMANRELEAIAAGLSPAAGETIAKVAQVLGMIGTICLGLALLWVFAMGGMVVLNAWLDQIFH